MANDWDRIVNPYTGAVIGPSPAPAPGGWTDTPANPYVNDWHGGGAPRNPYAAAPAQPLPAPIAEAYSRGVTHGEEQEDAAMMRRMRTDLAIRDLVGSKKSGAEAAAERSRKTAATKRESEESDEERRLRLYRELHDLDRGTERMARDLDVQPPARPSPKEALERAMAARRAAAPPMPPRPVAPPAPSSYDAAERDPRVQALNAGNDRFATTLAGVPPLTLSPGLRY